jgi:hypothetical protein
VTSTSGCGSCSRLRRVCVVSLPLFPPCLPTTQQLLMHAELCDTTDDVIVGILHRLFSARVRLRESTTAVQLLSSAEELHKVCVAFVCLCLCLRRGSMSCDRAVLVPSSCVGVVLQLDLLRRPREELKLKLEGGLTPGLCCVCWPPVCVCVCVCVCV